MPLDSPLSSAVKHSDEVLKRFYAKNQKVFGLIDRLSPAIFDVPKEFLPPETPEEEEQRKREALELGMGKRHLPPISQDMVDFILGKGPLPPLEDEKPKIETEGVANDPSAGVQLSRPGVSPKFFQRQGIFRVDKEHAAELLDFPVSSGGLWIPYCDPYKSGSLMVNGRPFGRLRLDKPSNDAKYLSPKVSGARLYVPSGPPFDKELVLCEGEFKALALCEAGIRAVGLGGISSAMSQGQLISDLQKLLSKWTPKVLYFLGDNDTALNFAFAFEATKLRKLLRDMQADAAAYPVRHAKGD